MQYHKQNIGYNIVSKTKHVDYKEFEEKIKKVKIYFNSVKNNLINNSLFYKNFSFKLGKILNSKNNFNSSSSSIIKNPFLENTYIMNTRVVNYKLDSFGKSNSPGNCITINKISILDIFLNEISFKYFYPNDLNKKYAGIEDTRLFNFDNKIYFIGSYYNPKNNTVQIVSNTLKNYNNPIIINPTFKTNFSWEKNWVFFKNNDEMNIIYKWSPIYICKIDYPNKKLNLIKSIENLPDIFNKFRGSTNGVIYDNKIWFIVHQQQKIIYDIKGYLHNFVVFDKNMNLLGYSKSFNFENNIVEFCIGMEIGIRNNFVITYSTLDSSTKLVVFTPDYVNSLINYI